MRNMCKYARFHTDSDTANIRRNKYLIASKGVAAAGVGGGVCVWRVVLQGRVRIRHW